MTAKTGPVFITMTILLLIILSYTFMEVSVHERNFPMPSPQSGTAENQAGSNSLRHTPCTGSSTIGGKRSSMDANVADRELPRKWVIDKQKSQNLLQEMLCVYQYADESGQLSFPFHDIFSASSGLS